jgi:hypothetical protein
MKKIIKSIFMITPTIFFLACGDNTNTPLKDIASVSMDDSDLSIYSTDSRTLTATVTYTDGTTAQINEPDVWTNSDYSSLNMYDGEIIPASNAGSSIVGVSASDFSDEINVSIIGLTDFNISSADITTTGDHILEATGLFEDNTSKVIKRNIVWSATNDATITLDEDYVATINILSGDTNVTATVFEETNTSAALAPVSKIYSVN